MELGIATRGLCAGVSKLPIATTHAIAPTLRILQSRALGTFLSHAAHQNTHHQRLYQTELPGTTTTAITQFRMADSPGSSDLSSPPSEDYDHEDQLSTQGPPSRRRSIEQTPVHDTTDRLAPPAKRRRTNHNASLLGYERAPSSQPEEDDTISLSSDGFSDGPGSPTHDEWAVRDEAQVECLWRDCAFGPAENNDELVDHVQSVHCATGGPKKTKYVCEWGECQRKNSNHPSGYALKAHMRSHTKEKPYYCSLPGECMLGFWV